MRSGGFTLIELLAVMLILGILMTLIIGATKMIFEKVYTDETKANMTIIMVAVRKYQEVQQDKEYDGLTASNWVDQLKKAPESKALIKNLPESVWSVDKKSQFRDAWGNKMEFKPTGGLGGAPGLVSSGPDGDSSTKDDNVLNNK